jgi:uncharacterized membrane protein YbhN (UPF0104 family)
MLLVVGAVPATRKRVLALVPSSLESTVENVAFTYQILSRLEIATAVGYSIARWLLGIGMFLPLASALDLRIGIPLAVLVVGFMTLTASLPISPGSVDPVKSVGVGILVLFGLDSTAALSLMFLQRSLGLVLRAVIEMVVYSYRICNLDGWNS